MASPPAPDPPSTTASTPIPAIPFAPSVRPSSNSMAPNPKPLSKQQLAYSYPARPPNPTPLQLSRSPQGGVPYPVASSGRGYIPKASRPPDHSAVTIASRSVLPFSQQQHLMGSVKGIPVPTPAKVSTAPSPSAKPAGNGYKDLRDRIKDDSVIVVQDRKVRLSAGDSLYGLGRSWLRNGFPEEHLFVQNWQPQFGDFSKTLPKPSPVADGHTSEDKQEEHEDKEENVEDLSAKDLLRGHIQRAKRVRLRAKEDRMKRISRFRTRIALLLPQEVEQFRSDAAATAT